MSLKITEADIEAYQNDGAVLIKGLLNDQEVSDLRKVLRQIFLIPA